MSHFRQGNGKHGRFRTLAPRTLPERRSLRPHPTASPHHAAWHRANESEVLQGGVFSIGLQKAGNGHLFVFAICSAFSIALQVSAQFYMSPLSRACRVKFGFAVMSDSNVHPLGRIVCKESVTRVGAVLYWRRFACPARSRFLSALNTYCNPFIRKHKRKHLPMT
jgi:hypothetical protein